MTGGTTVRQLKSGMTPEARDALVVQLAEEGLTYAAIGERLSVKRQRVKQIIDAIRNSGVDVQLPKHMRQATRAAIKAATPQKTHEMARAALADGADPKTIAALRAYLHTKRSRCRQMGVPFELTFDDLWPIPDICPALGIPISLFATDRDHAYSLDQIRPRQGYVKGNVVAVSYRANRIKNDATPDELQRIAKFYSNPSSADPQNSGVFLDLDTYEDLP